MKKTIPNNVKFHRMIPLGMVEGNPYRVWGMNGSEFIIKQSEKYGPYLTYRHKTNQKFVTISRLYKEIFPEEKKSAKVQTEFSKGDLKQQNRKGVYIPSANTRNNLISVSGYILNGIDKGKHLRDFSDEKLIWYTKNINLKNNELIEINAELHKRELL